MTIENTAPTFILSTGYLIKRVESGPTGLVAIDIQENGKIIFASSSVVNPGDSDLTLLRFNQDGSLDTGFSYDGMATLEVSEVGRGNDWIRDVVVQKDDKILVAGYTSPYGSGVYGIVLVRFNSDGSLDQSFGDNGVVTTFHTTKNLFLDSLELLEGGELVIAGSADLLNRNSPGYGTLLIKYNGDGTVDENFGNDGIILDSYTNGAKGLVIQPDGKLVVLGNSDDGNDLESYQVVARYESNGNLDLSFGENGISYFKFGDLNVASDIAIQSDGKLITVGYTRYSVSEPDSLFLEQNFLVVRYNTDGSIDNTFSEDGMAEIDFADGIGKVRSYDFGYSVVVQPDNKVLVAGHASYLDDDIYPDTSFYFSTNTDFALARLNTDGTLDNSFSSDGLETTDLQSHLDTPYALALGVDGSIVLAGTAYQYDPNNFESNLNLKFAISKYTSVGDIDLSFNLIDRLSNTTKYTENGEPIYLNPYAMVYDQELNASGNYSGAKIILMRESGVNASDVYSRGGELGPIIEGSVLTYSGTVVGSTIQNSQGHLEIKFNISATQEIVNSVLQSIKYSNASDNPEEQINIIWTFNDGNSGMQGEGGELSVTGISTINITSVNDLPTAIGSSITVHDSVPYVLSEQDFGFFDAEDGSTLTAVKILRLPLEGSLLYDGFNLLAGVEVSMLEIQAGLLTFVWPEENGDQESVFFEFTVKDSDSAYSLGRSKIIFNVVSNLPPFGRVLVDGMAVEGANLTADTSTLADEDGLGEFGYQWLRNGVGIDGATAVDYTLTEADVGAQISVEVTYTDGGDTLETVVSAATAAVEAAFENTPPTGEVTITGTATEGENLTANPDAVVDVDGLGEFNYQWLRDGETIDGATSVSYALTNADVGAQISVTVSYTDGEGTEESLTSAATATVTPVDPVNEISFLFSYQEGDVEVTLVSGVVDGMPDPETLAILNNLQQLPVPEDLPSYLNFPLGLVSFEAEVSVIGKTEIFSLFVDQNVPVNGYWKQTAEGEWVNLASSIVRGNGQVRIDFSLTDGGEFDADGEANGVIVDPGALGTAPRPVLTLEDKVLALYIAYFNRAPDADGMAFWLEQAANGQSLYDISAGFANHPRFAQEYGGLTNADVAEKIYLNVLRRPGDEDGIDYWAEKLDSEDVSHVVVEFVVGALEIDLDALLAAGDLTPEVYSQGFERQKVLENLMQASRDFLETFGDATIPMGSPETVAETPAYQAAVAVLNPVGSDLNEVFNLRDALIPLVGQPDAMDQVLNLFG